MKNILVTGCAGFIGSNFIKQFKTQYPDARVVGIDNFSSGRREAVHAEIDFYEGSILDRKLLGEIFTKHSPEVIFHFAAMPRVSYSVEHPVETSEANIMGTINILDQARQSNSRRVVFSSSSSVYGGAKILPSKESENAPDPKSPYALQKYFGEPLCKMFSDLYKLDTVCFRYFNVFGPGQFGDSPYSTVISAWLEALYFPQPDKKPFIEGDGSQSRDFCYVNNVVQANIKAAEHAGKLGGEVFNVGHGERTTILEVRDLIEELTGKKLDLEQRAPRLGDVKHTQADISKAKEMLGYNPTVNFKASLAKTVEWFESRKKSTVTV